MSIICSLFGHKEIQLRKEGAEHWFDDHPLKNIGDVDGISYQICLCKRCKALYWKSDYETFTFNH